MIYNHPARVEGVLLAQVHGALGALDLVAVWRMHHYQHVELPGQFKLCAQVFLFQSAALVEADFAYCQHAFLVEKQRQEVHDLFRQPLVVRFLGVEAYRAIVVNPELGGAEALPAYQGGEIVPVGFG